jgi:hypothetical protein
MSQNLISSSIGYSLLVCSELLMNRPHVSKYKASTVFKYKEIIYFAPKHKPAAFYQNILLF